MTQISVILPDGSSRTLDDGATVATLAADIGSRLVKDAVIGVIDGVERDLDTPLADGQKVEIVTPESEQGLHVMRHSTAHVLAQAVLELWPGATFAIGPPIEHGFYYDFELPPGEDGAPQTFNDDDLERIEAKMHQIVEADQPFVRSEVGRDEALALMADHPYKRAIIEQVSGVHANAAVAAADADLAAEAGDGEVISFYRNFRHLHRHVYRAPRAFDGPSRALQADERGRCLLAGRREEPDVAADLRHRCGRIGSSWRPTSTGSRRRPSGDHRKLANELDLLSFPSELGGGLAIWHPKGATIRKLMEDYSRRRHTEGGLRVRLHPPPGESAPVRDVGPPRLLRPRHVPARWRWTTARTTRSR